jgi:putative ABC transport system permease protein
MTWLGLALKALSRKAARSVLTATAIAVAFLVFGVLAAARTAFSGEAVTGAGERLVVFNRAHFTLPLPYAYVSRVRALSPHDQVSYADWFGGYFRTPREFFATFAVDAQTYLDLYDDFVVDRAARASFESQRDAALVGERLAARYGWKPGDMVPLASAIFRKADGSRVWDVRVAGVFTGATPAVNTNVLLMHHEYLADALPQGGDDIGWLIVKARDSRDTMALASAIDRTFTNGSPETQTTTEQVFASAFARQMGDVGRIVIYVCAAAFFSILLVTMATMMAAAAERMREFAVMRALGFSSAAVVVLVLAEAALLCGIGSIVGMSLAAAALHAVRTSLPDLPPLALDGATLAVAAAISLALALLASFPPAWRVSRLSAAEALRRE